MFSTLKTKALVLLTSFKNEIVDTWEKIKVPVIAIAALIISLRFRELVVTWITKAGQREVKDDNKKDQQIAAQESQESAEADALQAEANSLPSEQPPVGEDWYKKQ